MFKAKLDYSLHPDSSPEQVLNADLFRLLLAIKEHGSLAEAARAIGWSYRHVWGLMEKWEQVLNQPVVFLERGRGAKLTPFGDKLLWAEQRARARFSPRLDSLQAELEREFAELLQPAQSRLMIHASHDLALARLRDSLAQNPKLNLDLEFHGSLDSLTALSQGQCELAGFHVAEGHGKASLAHLAYRQRLKPRSHLLIQFVTRQQGLIVAPGNPLDIHGVHDLARLGIRFVNRQKGSGTRLEFDQLLWDAGINRSTINGYQREEFTHLAVAATVASNMADAGFGIKAAAAEFGLDFIPLANERYFFACRNDTVKQPHVQDFIAALKSQEFLATVAGLAGYDAERSGEICGIRESLPWYDNPGRRSEATRFRKHPDPTTA
jgi:putative molybdopterin biosynthesis protein